jgi:hypothetical protein
VNYSPENLEPDDIVLEALPDEVLASMESRDRWMASLQYDRGGLEFLVADLQSWTPGQAVRVAFLGGSPELHPKIEEATRQVTDNASVTLDFKDNGSYRTWTTNDTEHAAEIRVSFDQGGYFSLVGTDSVNPSIGMPQSPVGGLPQQRSLNLGGYDVALPQRWQGTVRHEFLHALAFHHEHQNMRGPCEAAFRWEDDPGYQPTKDARGAYIPDAANRRPGIYTYLSGFPNGWSKSKVDHNLRTSADSPALTAGPFDPASVMLYRFPPLFYRTQPSPCAPTGDGQELSDGDKRALGLLYPEQAEALAAIGERREALLSTIESGAGTEGAGGGLESTGALPEIASHAAQNLRLSLEELRR